MEVPFRVARVVRRLRESAAESQRRGNLSETMWLKPDITAIDAMISKL
jgi:hypothetical protein